MVGLDAAIPDARWALDLLVAGGIGSAVYAAALLLVAALLVGRGARSGTLLAARLSGLPRLRRALARLLTTTLLAATLLAAALLATALLAARHALPSSLPLSILFLSLLSHCDLLGLISPTPVDAMAGARPSFHGLAADRGTPPYGRAARRAPKPRGRVP